MSTPQPKPTLFGNLDIPVELCCNKGSNGQFSGRLTALNIGPNLRLCSHAMSYRGCPQMRWSSTVDLRAGIQPTSFCIGRRTFQCHNHRPWVGSWCWDAVSMRGRDVLALLNWPRLRRWFDVEDAEVRLYHWWKSGHAWVDDDLRLLSKDFAGRAAP